MVGDGEAVGFVPEPQEQEPARGVGRGQERIFAPRQKEAVADRAAALFRGLGQAHHRDFRQVQFLEGLEDHVELAPAAVHHQEVW